MLLRHGRYVLQRERSELPQHGERPAAEMRYVLRLREAPLQAVGDMLQQQIPGAASVGIIDEAQALDVEHRDGVT